MTLFFEAVDESGEPLKVAITDGQALDLAAGKGFGYYRGRLYGVEGDGDDVVMIEDARPREEPPEAA